jgi:hypothetical protein
MFLRLDLSAALLALVALGGNARAHDLSLSWQHRSGGTIYGVSIGNGSFDAFCTPAPCPPPAGTWEVVEERVWIPARESRIWISPIYRTWYDHCGHAHSVLVRPGYWQNTCEPGHWEVRQRKVWIPNYRPLSRGYYQH